MKYYEIIPLGDQWSLVEIEVGLGHTGGVLDGIQYPAKILYTGTKKECERLLNEHRK